jgi:hypothetical protein
MYWHSTAFMTILIFRIDINFEKPLNETISSAHNYILLYTGSASYHKLYIIVSYVWLTIKHNYIVATL